jgi:hypothetical protein
VMSFAHGPFALRFSPFAINFHPTAGHC